MKNAIATLLAATLSFSATAEESYQAPLVEKSVLLDIAASDYVVMVGERGHILFSANGTDFTQANVPSQTTLTATAIAGDQVWAVGHDASILHSSDRGVSWEIQNSQPELERPFLDVLFLDAMHGIAIGAYGLFYRTQDGGVNWEAERHASLLDPMDQEYLEEIRQEDEDFYLQELDSILPHLNRITRAGDKLYLAGEAGLLAMSDDEGRHWQRFELDYMGSFFDIQALDEQTLIAVGLRGNIFLQREGQEWQSVVTCSTSTLNSVLSLGDQVLALGNNGMMIQAQRPLTAQQPDPYADPEQCDVPEGIIVSQLKNKSAILNAVQFQGQILAVTSHGIKQLNLK